MLQYSTRVILRLEPFSKREALIPISLQVDTNTKSVKVQVMIKRPPADFLLSKRNLVCTLSNKSVTITSEQFRLHLTMRGSTFL